MTRRVSIAFTGGGTAGHVIPTIPVISSLLDLHHKVIFIGSNSGLEEKLLADLQVSYFGIKTGKLRRYFSLKNLLDAFLIPIGVLQALLILLRMKPKALFSKGGYVAFPVVIAAWLLRIPVVAHESDLSPGLATRLCTPFIKTQCVTFEQTKSDARKVVVSGTPIREFLKSGDPQRARDWLKITDQRPVIVVVGGSLGAQSVNAIIRECITSLRERFTVIHVCGRGNLDASLQATDGYFQFEFVDQEWGNVLALADFVVSRAGANALFELLYLQKTNLLIPLPLSVSRGDQIENAEYAEVRGWSLVLPEERLNKETFMHSVDQLVTNQTRYQSNLTAFSVPDAVAVIVREIDAVISA